VETLKLEFIEGVGTENDRVNDFFLLLLLNSFNVLVKGVRLLLFKFLKNLWTFTQF